MARLTFLYGFHLEVRTVPVTHLVEADHLRAERALLDYGKGIGARRRRETRGGRISRGGLVIVRYGIFSRVTSGAVSPQSPIDVCTVVVLPTEDPTEFLRVTGVSGRD